MRVEENLGGGTFDALGRALEAASPIELNQEWKPNKSRKVKSKALPGGGLKVTAATGHFDVCAGLVGPVFGVARGAFKLLSKPARARLVQPLRDSALNIVERVTRRMYRKDKKRIAKELKGEINPKTGKPRNKEWRKKKARRVAKERMKRNRRALYELIDGLAEKLINAAVPKKCFRAWKPKITARIYVDGTATMIETGFFRGWLWQVVEDDAGS